jgi:Mu transposase, C-terminal domain/NAD(P)H-binding
MNERTVTVCGGTGFLGHRVVRHLRKRRFAVRIASRHPGRDHRLFGLNDPQLQSVAANIHDERSVADALAGAYGVVNAVSLYVEHGQETFHSVHVESAERVAAQARRAGVERLAHVSGIGSDAASTSPYIRKRGEGELAVRAAFAQQALPHRHPEFTERTIWEVFEAERPKLIPNMGRFDGFYAVPASVSKTCLVRFDNNKYSVAASAVGRPVEVHAYADCVVIRRDGRIVAARRHPFGRGETVYDPWHYVPVLARKLGGLHNGAPFKDRALPAAMERVRCKLAGADDGNRQMVDILSAVLSDGLPAVETASTEAIAHGVHSADVIPARFKSREDDPASTALAPSPRPRPTLRRRERYRQNPPLKGAPFGRLRGPRSAAD